MRLMAASAPLLLLTYGVLRWIDGLDGHRKGGPAWDLGHLAFFGSMAVFAVLAVALVRRTPKGRGIAVVAAAAAVFGAGCFLWVIAGDLSDRFRQEWPLPGALEIAGPMLFVLGMVVLLSLQVAAGRAPVWSPVLLFAGYAAITVDLDLLPPAALVILAAVAPLGRAAATPPFAVPVVSRLH
ncbi:hypothetical protein [Actinoplanes sp. NPDC026619]|uniref:hypothetical protein n=1 Tax=Actinoplanes sp. NPDC026619 TaxID=3155798 RepID=UPI0033FB2229